MTRRGKPALNTVGWTPGHCAALAAGLEASIPKPGNVGRGADFADTTLYDFLIAAQILGQEIDRGQAYGIGQVILNAVSSTRAATGNNPNLGIVLLLVPLARAAKYGQVISIANVRNILDRITPEDSSNVFEAIRRANPGGLGESDAQDITNTAEPDLMAAMKLAAGRDLIAREYDTGFSGVIETVCPLLGDCIAKTGALDRGVVLAQVSLIATMGDTLIERKCGKQVADQARAMALKAVEKFSGGWDSFEKEVAELDFWMRSDGNRRNPGTTADLIAAGIFLRLWSGDLEY